MSDKELIADLDEELTEIVRELKNTMGTLNFMLLVEDLEKLQTKCRDHISGGWVSVDELQPIIDKMRKCDYSMALSDLIELTKPVEVEK